MQSENHFIFYSGLRLTVKQHAFAKHVELLKIDRFYRFKGAGLQLNLEKCGG